MALSRKRVALIGGRGYAGASFLPLLSRHPDLELALASSSAQAGQPLREIDPDWPDPDTRLEALAPDGVAAVDARVWVLALPNGASEPWVRAIDATNPEALIIDLGADYRFDPGWAYGLSEWNRQAIAGARRIANPGCYATGAQFALLPIREYLTRPPVIFGVSGYSGAGRTPSPRNDPERLADNLIPYSLTGHLHEREISTHLGRPVRFHPHVASFFRGISLTLTVNLSEELDASRLLELYREAYRDAPLIEVTPEIPEIREIAGRPGLRVGGFAIDPRQPYRVTFVAVLDNLLKGAASQALQNINLALGLDELTGIRLKTADERAAYV
ncbi:N-acetyl-gamma-glutamyl-phosphate reductase [Wenzhouxiangella sp. C33]|uniref:N-acetyl-gamma-glutamyl-phosphate reductase n=1 Tax=Wenzhouxiangella limi TaxID=2707351 RepID=A0A845UUH0_9GAMM|nr:N-acetyl-gamma-glutamyl-phosphate reductase [Wenzhouxiangella limi]